MDAGLLPVKRLRDAKQRLAADLKDDERLQLSRALLDDALDRCEKTPFLRWWVITDDPEVEEAARRRGVGLVADPGLGLNEALAAGIAAAVASDADSVTILPVDVPLATAEDVQDLVDTGTTSDVVLATARVDGGTNGLYLEPPNALRPRFGPASLRVHIADAEKAKLRCSILHLPRLALDVDTMEDAELLIEEEAAEGASVRVLRELLSD
ncbi:MAG: 2-phospho-L-lactate guanylyltransferase [Actinomycetota bacterium]|nr:2-phospho-L-lactate guanylyltransferase [Actinomycetota bacterium]